MNYLPTAKETDSIRETVNNVAQLGCDVRGRAVKQNKADGGGEEEVVDKNPNDETVRRYCRFLVSAGGQCVAVVSEGDPEGLISRIVAVVGFTNVEVAQAAIRIRDGFPWETMDSRLEG